MDETLYVADLDTLRAFDARNGKPVASIHVVDGKALVHLTDVAYDGVGLLYCSDQHANRIYRVELPSQKVTLLVADPALAGPAGLAVHPKSGELIAVSWNKGKIFAISPTGTVSELFSNGFSQPLLEPAWGGLRSVGQHVRVRLHDRQSLADDLGQTVSGHRRVSAYARRPQH